MANIVGIENMTAAQIRSEIAQGGRFVHYIWCVSIIVMTFRRSSDIYFIPAGKSAISKGLPFTFLTVLLGWWGFHGGRSTACNVSAVILQAAMTSPMELLRQSVHNHSNTMSRNSASRNQRLITRSLPLKANTMLLPSSVKTAARSSVADNRVTA